jgi:predicted glycosyltransferase
MKRKNNPGQLRVAFYSHDTQGLGHIRRNLAIAAALNQTESPPVMLMISGTQLGSALTTLPGVDFLALPAVAKAANGRYCARSMTLPLADLIRLRMSTIRGALAAFAPDVFIVDKTPTGLQGELLPVLQMLRQRRQTRCVLGLRDVLDDPVTTRREWNLSNSEAVIDAYYDAVWVYGDPAVYDPIREYGLADELADKVRYTGYLDRHGLSQSQGEQAVELPFSANIEEQRLALCTVGGGQDGGDLSAAFARAEFPPDTAGILVTGPYMPYKTRKKLQRLAAHRSHLQVLEFVPEPLALLQRADYVIAMGGYNTVCEILAQRKPALIVPRVKPRQEQWIRAERLRNLGLLDVLHPNQLTPDRLSQWLAGAEERPLPAPMNIDLNGLTRLPHLLNELLEVQPA